MSFLVVNIYDVIVLPSVDTEKMAEIEFRRFYEYARLAENKDELLLQLETLAGDYGLELDNFVTIFDEEKEALPMPILRKITKQICLYMNEQGYTLHKKCFYSKCI